MIIIHGDGSELTNSYFTTFPDQFKSQLSKTKPKWIKNNLDFFANEAYKQYLHKKDKYTRNYELMKGKLTPADFYEEKKQVKSFIDQLEDEELELPADVKHYPILNPPINTCMGEMAHRPNSRFVKDFSDEGKAEEIEAKTQMVQSIIMQMAQAQMAQQAAMNGEPTEGEEFDAKVMEELEENLASYTTLAESWANHILKATDMYFNMKEKSEDGFRDLLIVAQEYFHIFEDNSRIGFNIEVVNPKNLWQMTTPDKKYVHKGNGSHEIGAYAAGTVQVMELSEIIEKFRLPKDEIDHLRKNQDSFGILNTRRSNLFKPSAKGPDSVTYDVYDPLVLQERMIAESQLSAGDQDVSNWFGLNNMSSTFSLKFAVVQAYWASKIKIGRLRYLDEFGYEQSVQVDEYYEEGTIPGEIDVEWNYETQWYMGYKIGPDIYHAEPLKILNYCPIIGVTHEGKNTEAKSMVDLMKPYQMIYNVAINQLWKLMEKEHGVVFLSNIRSIPTPKDGDPEDAIDMWEAEMRRRGLIILDDSPENMKGPSAFNQFSRVDLSRANEMKARIELAQWCKQECWELIGVNRERTGDVAATQTATGTQTAMAQSYSQTEPLFTQHSYLMNDVFQAILDTAQSIESQKPLSTIKYITNEGEQAFVQVQGQDLQLRDLYCFVTDRSEDVKSLQDFRMLAQAMLQNGATGYEIAKVFSTNSMRKVEQIMEKVKAKQEQFMQQQQEAEAAATQGEQQLRMMEMEHETMENEKDRINENFNKELDRINKKEVAAISASGLNENALADNDGSGVADALEITKTQMDIVGKQKDYEMKMEELMAERRTAQDNKELELEKIKVARENMKNDLEIAKIQATEKKAKEAKAAKKKAQAAKKKK